MNKFFGRVLYHVMKPVIGAIAKVDKKIYGLEKPIDSIGPYDIYKVVGKGGCGIVYLAFSNSHDQFVALKTYRDDLFSSGGIVNRFTKEAEVWINLDEHPNIVKAIYVDNIDNRIFIVMEYINGLDGLVSLNDYFVKGRIDRIEAIRWSIQFCHGMEFAFKKGIKAHRDIKPANILIQNGNLKITDFGLSGLLYQSHHSVDVLSNVDPADNLTAFGIGMGTPTHMAPEQFNDATHCDEKSDIYSFGIVLYQMVSAGKLPFHTDQKNNYWRIMQHLHSEAPVPVSIVRLATCIQRRQ